MSATTQVKIDHGAGPTVANAESGIRFGRADGVTPTTPVLKPTDDGTAFSFPKTLHLQVVSGGGATAISSRTIALDDDPATGIELFFKDGGDTYVQATTPADSDAGSSGANPTGYTPLSTTPQTWDASSESAVNDTRNGNFVVLAAGLSDDFAGGAGSATLPNIVIGYIEA